MPEFPKRTAGDIVLSNGDMAWVCTLNSLLSDEVDEECRFYTSKKCRSYMKTGADYSAILTEVRGKTDHEQAQLIVASEWQKIISESQQKYPSPEKPALDDEEPIKNIDAIAKWEEDCKKADTKRKAFETKRYEADIEKSIALTAKVRIERAYAAWVSQQWASVYSKRYVLEVLHRSVRLADDHATRYFPSVVHVEDADDEVLNALTDFYFKQLATVTNADIPTSPAAS